MKANYFEKH